MSLLYKGFLVLRHFRAPGARAFIAALSGPALTIAASVLAGTVMAGPPAPGSSARGNASGSTSSTSAAPGSPAARAIERHVAWLGGWAALDSLRDLSLTGVIHVAGLEGSISVEERRDGRRRSVYDLKAVRGADTITPDGR